MNVDTGVALQAVKKIYVLMSTEELLAAGAQAQTFPGIAEIGPPTPDVVRAEAGGSTLPATVVAADTER